jgi:branched-chain amino acid transport system permease protein
VTLLRHLAAAAAIAVALALLSVWLTPFRDYQLAEIGCYVTAVAGLTMLVGQSGQISLGHGAFLAIGAYTAALLQVHLHWPLAALLVASAVTAAASGAAVGAAAARLRGPYLAGATLMLAVALPSLAIRYTGLFGGDQGLTVTGNVPAFLGPSFPLTRWQAWLSCGCALIVAVGLANLARSRVGRAWRAVADDEVAAALAGLNVARLRVLAFVISAACAGLAGALLAVTTSIVSPGAFTLTLSIALLTAAVLGGLGRLPGAVWGSAVLVLVPTYVTDVAASHGLSSSAGSNIPVAAYGVVLILVMLLFPDGLQGALDRLAHPAIRLARPAASRLGRRAASRLGRRATTGLAPAPPTPGPRAPASEHQEEGST